MQTSTLESAPSDASPPTVGSSRPTPTDHTLCVTATYALSEDGRKRLLLAGGDGRSLQQLTIAVPANRLHLVAVDANGLARLKLRPRYELNSEQRVIRIDAPPTFDAPPATDTLLQHAARNHQLERTFDAQRHAARAARRQADHDRRAQIATAFLDDAAQRAVGHPPPTPHRCVLLVNGARLLFDVRSDQGPARAIPPEAHRRFRADRRADAERGQQQHQAQRALHDEKKMAVMDWIERYGTAEQRSRHAAGVLPMAEVVEAIADQTFAPLHTWTRYVPDGAVRLEAHLRRMPAYAHVTVTGHDLTVTSRFAPTASAAQWTFVMEAQRLIPDALVALRVHTLAWVGDRDAPTLTLVGVLITKTVGPFTLRREYLVEES